MSKSAFGSFTFILHSHLPYVLSHGKWPHGTEWLCEAATETYIPLLDALNRLVAKGISPKLTLGLTPVLCEMLADPSFKSELQNYLAAKIEEAKQNTLYFKECGENEYRRTGEFWVQWHQQILDSFNNRYDQNLIGAFRELQNAGHIEIITSAATHGYLPLLGNDDCVRAQIAVGVQTYKKHFGRVPHGFWLPECAYHPSYEWRSPFADKMETTQLRRGLEEFLAEQGIAYFIVDTHLFSGGSTLGVYAERFPVLKQLYDHSREQETPPQNPHGTPHRAYWVDTQNPDAAGKVAALARHERTSMQVWSADHGYPGNGAYLDFHKKHFPGGLRYWRVTSRQADLGEKQPYQRDAIDEIIESQAAHFVDLICDGLQNYQKASGEKGFICCPYDTELFGHWWFEGVQWLETVLEKLAVDPRVTLSTGSEIIEAHPPTAAIALPEGSWGEGGFHHVWLNENTAWTWKEIYQRETQMTALAQKYFSTENIVLRQILDQCARELLLMESSDWQFLISTIAAKDYAELRIANHIEAFDRLVILAEKIAAGETLNNGEQKYFYESQERDRVFAEVDFGCWK
jgi:1,4-alpha-glucan branching enzyme